MRRLPNRGRHHQAHGSDILQFRAGAAAGRNARAIARRAIQTLEPYSQPAESLNGAGIARLISFFPQRQLPSHSLLFSKFINSASYHDVFGGDPVRFEQRDLGVAGATGSFSRNNFGKVDHVGPAALIVAVHLNQVAGFELRLFPGVGDDEVAAAYGFGVEFVLLRKIGADGVEVRSGREPAAFDDWIRGGGGGHDDVHTGDGLFRRGHGGDGNFERGDISEANVSRFCWSRLKARTLSIFRAWEMASSWVRAWRPVPMMPTVLASARARSRVARPLAAPVRIWPT